MAKTKRKKRDLGLIRHSRYLSAVDVGAVGVALGKRGKELREAAGLSTEALAKHIGATAIYVEKVESGKVHLTQEGAYRWVKACLGRETWRDAPNLRGIGDKADPGVIVRITLFDDEIIERWHAFAAATGSTLSAVARYALERLFDHEPTLLSIKEGVAIAEKMRAQALLESCPAYVAMLKADPALARIIGASGATWKPVNEEGKSFAPTDMLAPSDPRNDGPATPIERLK